MIRIRKMQSCACFPEIARCQPFNVAECSDRHEAGRLDLAMGRTHDACPRLRLGIGMKELKEHLIRLELNAAVRKFALASVVRCDDNDLALRTGCAYVIEEHSDPLFVQV